MSTQAETHGPRGQIVFDCRCGDQVSIRVDHLGETLQCPSCKRYLRPGISMILSPKEHARNITVVCPQGHFVVSESKRPGRVVACKMCHQNLVLPPAQERPVSEVLVRIPGAALRRAIQVAQPKPEVVEEPEPAIDEVAFRTAGQRRCPNPKCGQVLPGRANICQLCGTNQVTGKMYLGKDPAREPIKGLWPGALNW